MEAIQCNKKNVIEKEIYWESSNSKRSRENYTGKERLPGEREHHMGFGEE